MGNGQPESGCTTCDNGHLPLRSYHFCMSKDFIFSSVNFISCPFFQYAEFGERVRYQHAGLNCLAHGLFRARFFKRTPDYFIHDFPGNNENAVHITKDHLLVMQRDLADLNVTAAVKHIGADAFQKMDQRTFYCRNIRRSIFFSARGLALFAGFQNQTVRQFLKFIIRVCLFLCDSLKDAVFQLAFTPCHIQRRSAIADGPLGTLFLL